VLNREDSLGRPYAIRPARPADAAAIRTILSDLADAGDFILLSPGEVGADDGPRRDEILRASSNPDRWYLAVVEQDAAVVGMLDMRAVPLQKCSHVMEVGIGLAPAARDRGIGTALMRHAVERARAAGCRKLRLFVIAGNDRAGHIYGKVGFRETGRYREEVRVDGQLRDLVVMERQLT